MSTRNLRNRSSRFSSPAINVDREPAIKPAEVPEARNDHVTSLHEWEEPRVRDLVPSFEDHRGLERVGTLEHMQPLGTRPTPKILQRLKLNPPRPSPRPSVLQYEEASTPVGEYEKMETASPLDTEMIPDTTPLEEPVRFSSPPRGRPPRRELIEMSLMEDGMTPSPIKSTFTSSAHVSPKPQSIQQHLRQDRLQNYVQKAIDEAHHHGNVGLVPGLQRLREDASVDFDLWNVIEAIIQGNPNEAQMRTLKRYIKAGVKRHRRSISNSQSVVDPLLAVNHVASPQLQAAALAAPTSVLSPQTGHIAKSYTQLYLTIQNQIKSNQLTSSFSTIRSVYVALAFGSSEQDNGKTATWWIPATADNVKSSTQKISQCVQLVVIVICKIDT